MIRPPNFDPWEGLVNCDSVQDCIDAGLNESSSPALVRAYTYRTACMVFNGGLPDRTLLGHSYCTCNLDYNYVVTGVGRLCNKGEEPTALKVVRYSLFFACFFITFSSLTRLSKIPAAAFEKKTIHYKLRMLTYLTVISYFVFVVLYQVRIEIGVEAATNALALEGDFTSSAGIAYFVLYRIMYGALGVSIVGIISSSILLSQVFRRARLVFKSRFSEAKRLPLNIRAVLLLINSVLLTLQFSILIPGTPVSNQNHLMVIPTLLAVIVTGGVIIYESRQVQSAVQTMIASAEFQLVDSSAGFISLAKHSKMFLRYMTFCLFALVLVFAGFWLSSYTVSRESTTSTGEPKNPVVMGLCYCFYPFALQLVMVLPGHFMIETVTSRIERQAKSAKTRSRELQELKTRMNTSQNGLHAGDSSDTY